MDRDGMDGVDRVNPDVRRVLFVLNVLWFLDRARVLHVLGGGAG